MKKNDVWQLIVCLFAVPLICLCVLRPTEKSVSDVRTEQVQSDKKGFIEEKIEEYLEDQWGHSIEELPARLMSVE